MSTTVMEKANFTKPKKPLIKAYFDLDAHLNKYLKARLPFLSTCNMKISQIFESKDETVHRFRVNWINSESGSVDLSRYVQITTNPQGDILGYNEN